MQRRVGLDAMHVERKKKMPREIFSPKPILTVNKSFDGKHTIQFNEASHRYKLDGKACVGTTTMVKAGFPTAMGLISWMKGQSINHLWNELMIQDVMTQTWNWKDSTEYGIDEVHRIEMFKAAKKADEKTSQEAADIGTLMHDYAYLTELGKTAEAEALYTQILQLPEEIKVKAINGITRFKDWKKTNTDELVASETLIASPTHLFCGKFDRLVKRNGVLILDDFKSSGSIYLEHFIQLGAYRLAIREWLGMNVEAIEVLRFGKEDGEFETMLIDDPKELQMFEDQAIRCRATYEFRKMEQDPRFEWKGKKA